ncbi:T4 family baseplate hub assembly chaperone [Streptomyces sp. NPDC001393]
MSSRRSAGASVGAAALLAVWEAGLAAGYARRALLLHSAARPAADSEELLSVPVGRRDADLFALRRELFGERLEVRATCRGCGEEMEFALGVQDVIGAGTAEVADGPLTVETDGWTVRFRLPTAGDLAVVEASPSADAGAELVARCVLHAERSGTEVAADTLPEHVRQRVAQAAAEADPGADVRLNLACPVCGHAATAELDIASYLWAELDAWARGTLQDVHLLAGHYGWSESEILALSPLRRRYYLELCADA